MREKLINYIRCPICKSAFELVTIDKNQIEIETGLLICRNCGYISNIFNGNVYLLYNLDKATINELNLHIKEGYNWFVKELKENNKDEIEKKWAYMEQESSKEYGINVKKIFYSTIKNAGDLNNKIVLDIRAGSGWSSAQLSKMGAYCIAIDLCEPIKLGLSKVFIKEGTYFERCICNMMQLPFEDNSIDVVTSMAALHHATDINKAMSEISRVLKIGGKLILIGEPVVPPDYFGVDKEFIKAKNMGFNEHQYSANDWFKIAENVNLFAIDGTKSCDNLNKYYETDNNGVQTPLPIFVKKASNDNKIKIAFLSQEYSKTCTGGNCRHTYLLAHGLANLGHEVHVVSKSNNGKEYEYMDERVHVHKILPKKIEGLLLSSDMDVSRKNLEYSYAVCLKLFELIKLYNIEIVESVSWDAEAFVYSLYKPVPLVVRIVTPLFKLIESQEWEITKDRKLANWIEGEAVRRADKVIAISNSIGKLFQDHHGVQENNIVFSPLGCELPDKKLLTHDKKDSKINVLFVGRLEKRKGIDTLFKAIPKVVDSNNDVQFWIVGKDTNCAPNGGSFKQYLYNILPTKYLSHVNFLGFVTEQELKELYCTCDIFVAPSLYESFGQIYIEAMAWGKPVIGCKVGGVPEVVNDGETGILIEPNNDDQLADAIIKLLTDKNMREIMGAKARKTVEEKFSEKVMTENTLKIYKSVINKFNYKLKY